jgi:hypothetical protein
MHSASAREPSATLIMIGGGRPAGAALCGIGLFSQAGTNRT